MPIRYALRLVLCAAVVAWAAGCASSSGSKPRRASREPAPDDYLAQLDNAMIERARAGQPPQRVFAVLDFEGMEHLRGKAEINMPEMLTTALVQTGRIQLVERNKIDRVIREQNLALAGFLDESRAAEVGRLVGAEYVIMGAVTAATKTRSDKFAYQLVEVTVAVDVRAVNASTGQILLSESAQGVFSTKEVRSADGTLVSAVLDDASAYAAAARQAIDRVGTRLGDLTPLVGHVLDVQGQTLTLSVGSEQGVRTGDLFVVFRLGDPIVHPVTGARVGWQKQVLYLAAVQRTEQSMATAQLTKALATLPVQAGDMVISRR